MLSSFLLLSVLPLLSIILCIHACIGSCYTTSPSITMSGNWQPQIPIQEIKAGPIENGPDGVVGSDKMSNGGGEKRKKVVVIGLGMVGISFM